MAPRTANTPQLTREQIVRAALRLIDTHGLDGQSMRALGDELGVDPSTIYYHVPSKAALYDLVVDAILSGVDISADDPARGLEDRVVAAGQEYRRALLRHPGAVPLIAVRSLRTSTQLRVIEALSRIFFDAGFSPSEALIAVDTCGLTILGMTNMHAAGLTGDEYGRQEQGSSGAGPGDALSVQYPNVARMLAASAALDADVEFERAMRVMAAGLLSLHADGALAPPATATGGADATGATGAA